MAIVDAAYYVNTYHADLPEDFERLEARAEDFIAMTTRWQVSEESITALPVLTQELYKKALCAQVEFYAFNGLEIMQTSANAGPGFTVGKVSVQSGGSSGARAGALSSSLAPLALGYLEQSGLLYPGVPVIGGMP